MGTSTIIMLLLGPVGFAVGWACGWGKGREHYAKVVVEQGSRLASLASEIEALEGEIMALTGAVPGVADAGRVLNVVSGGEDPGAA
jgi:hypothetical protein